MTFKEFIRLSWGKIIVAIILTLFWFFIGLRFFISYVECECVPGGLEGCVDYFNHLLIKNTMCHCTCIPLSEVILQYLNFIIIPLIVSYIISCVIFYFVKKKKKHKK